MINVKFRVYETSDGFMPCIEGKDGELEVWLDGTLLADEDQAEKVLNLIKKAYMLGRRHISKDIVERYGK